MATSLLIDGRRDGSIAIIWGGTADGGGVGSGGGDS
jgi:hypothetical protein